MQYPVFPWILADYDSEELDLTNHKTFRDLSKPMGAQTAARLDQFKKRFMKRLVFNILTLLSRFRDWDDAGTDSPPYHYGTHYSSAMIVSSYLVRLEPFTQHFLHLQVDYHKIRRSNNCNHCYKDLYCGVDQQVSFKHLRAILTIFRLFLGRSL